MKKLLKYTNLNKLVLFSLLVIPAVVTLTSAKDCWNAVTFDDVDLSPKLKQLIEDFKKSPTDKKLWAQIEVLLHIEAKMFWNKTDNADFPFKKVGAYSKFEIKTSKWLKDQNWKTSLLYYKIHDLDTILTDWFKAEKVVTTEAAKLKTSDDKDDLLTVLNAWKQAIDVKTKATETAKLKTIDDKDAVLTVLNNWAKAQT